MKIERLSWDSDFFNFEVGKISTENGSDYNSFPLEKLPFQLVYIFSQKPILDLFPVDVKLNYGKKVEKREKICHIEEISNQAISDELLELAYLSGSYSRFKIDKNIDAKKFKQMYRLWLERSINKTISDYVFAIKEQDMVKAFVTLCIKNNTGIIGLIAVSEKSQGKGYGRDLIRHCEHILSTKKIRFLAVATQEANLSACKFYESLGFNIMERIWIYHFWSQNIKKR